MGFRLKSGNRTSFKQMGGTEVSPAKDMKTGSYKQSFESPAKQKYDLSEATVDGEDAKTVSERTIKEREEIKKKKEQEMTDLINNPDQTISKEKLQHHGEYKPKKKKSPAKQKVNKSGEAQDQDKIFDDKGNHIGNWVNDKKVMFNDKPVKDKSLESHGVGHKKIMKDGSKNNVHIKGGKKIKDWQPHQFKKKKSPAKAEGDKIVDGVLCDAYGRPKPSKEQIAAGLKSPDFSNKAREAKGLDRGLGPAFRSPAKQTKDTFKDGSKKSSRDKFNDTETAIEQRKADRKDNQRRFTNKGVKTIVGEKSSGLGPRTKNSGMTRTQAARNRAEMAGLDANSPYWYKINGKTVSKKEYLNYENKPGGDEPGKQTNHPDIYGRIKNNHGRGPKTK